ncbi:ARL14 effector protein [Biomphalaria pfeifferi]|uniref:ARL14 effector protein n=1 Tax=Biomphalaria pfeifferi TaxID=112525 RepID=A0AAD8BIZ8_BIOPF|nr:ARL14 effector protein [Biomphalaria pfeifferi]
MAELPLCTFGLLLQDECHKKVHTRSVGLYNLSELSDANFELLMLRTKPVDHLQRENCNICFHHEQVLLEKFDKLQRNCCDPFSKHPCIGCTPVKLHSMPVRSRISYAKRKIATATTEIQKKVSKVIQVPLNLVVNEDDAAECDGCNDLTKLVAELKIFEDDEISRMCPGQKEFLSIRIDGQRVHRQKRLLLLNLKEMHVEFKKRTAMKIGLSKFCSLQPPWCITVDSSGAHAICVCETHQN